MQLHEANEYEDFMKCCQEIVDNSNDVSLNLENTKHLHTFFEKESLMPADWSWYARIPDDRNITWFDFVFVSSLNGGFYEMKNDKITKWEHKGSGSSALLKWINEEVWAPIKIPGVNLKTTEDVGIVFQNFVKDLPYGDWRLDVLKEFADPEVNRELQIILMSAEQADWTFSFTFDQVNKLVELFPASFGNDPFRKKAILACLLMGAWLLNNGSEVFYTLPIPSDYQIPRIFHWAGVIELSDSFISKIQDDTALLDVNSNEVTAFRAAACLAASKLADEMNVGDNIVDNFLFMGARKDESFEKESLSPMRCNTTWF